jgi:MHS family proline/betaine transporter-like MFS transporter
LIEWYDFYIFGSLATVISQQFFPNTNPTAALLSTLATFAAGFVVRPFGALFFGKRGDTVGRKRTFLATLVLMGGSTFAIGLIPSYESIGLLAPAVVLVLRLVQGLALGGEYGGAATYVAEHSPPGKRGFFTSFIQTTATLGLFVSLGVILGVRQSMTPEDFTSWGWRIPFLLSAVLVGISIYIRLKMQESPLFAKIKASGKVSANPIKESFGKKENLKLVLITLFGATAGQGVVWYTGQFYALSFIQNTCKVELSQSYIIIATALVFATPLFVFFGWWSDKVGRKYIMMAGMLIAALAYRPIYGMIYGITDTRAKIEVADGESIKSSTAFTDGGGSVRTTVRQTQFTDGTTLKEITKVSMDPSGTETATPSALREVVLGDTAFWLLIGLVFAQVVLVTMVYGPIAAFLVELFPTRIRYTSMSLPYHIGNGVFGGLTPLIATSLAASSVDPLVGLWYPIIVASVCFVIGMIFLRNQTAREVIE